MAVRNGSFLFISQILGGGCAAEYDDSLNDLGLPDDLDSVSQLWYRPTHLKCLRHVVGAARSLAGQYLQSVKPATSLRINTDCIDSLMIDNSDQFADGGIR